MFGEKSAPRALFSSACWFLTPILGTMKPNMGMKRKPTAARRATSGAKSSGLVDTLFSRTQQRVLGLLFGQPGRSFYANEIIQLAKGGSGSVQREIARLVQSGLVTVRAVGNQKHYQANPA